MLRDWIELAIVLAALFAVYGAERLRRAIRRYDETLREYYARMNRKDALK